MVEQPMETAVDPELPPIDESLLRQLVHQKLQELRHGDLFMEGLGEECYPTLLTNEKYYDVFTNILGAAWMNIHLGINVEHGLNGGKMKRKKKKFVRAIRQAREFVRPEIEHYKSLKHTPNIVRSNERNKDETKTYTFTSKAKETPPHEIADTVDSNKMDDVSSINSHGSSRYSKSSSKKKKKKSKKVKKKSRKDKRKYSKKGKARRKRSKYDDSDDDDSRMGSSLQNGTNNIEADSDDELVPVHYTKAEAKEKFEKSKADILRDIPKKVSDEFRALGFCKWSKEWLPCLQLSPYDVSPGQVRDSWMEMFNNCKLSGRPMTRLIFWYGTAADSMSDAYSFLPEKNLISYEEGCSKGYNEIPSKIAKKLNSNKKLTKNEEQHLRGLEEIKSEEKRTPEDRIGWLDEWQEDYELITDKEDIDATDDESMSVNSSSPLPKKSGGKRKSISKDDENEGKQRKKTKTSKIQHNLLKQKDGEIKMKKIKKSKKKSVEADVADGKIKGIKAKKRKETSADITSINLEDYDDDLPKKKSLGSKKELKKHDDSVNGSNNDIQMQADHEHSLNETVSIDEEMRDTSSVGSHDTDYELSDGVQEREKFKESNKSNINNHITEYNGEDHEETLRKEKRLKDFHRREKLRKEKCEREGVIFEPREYKPKGRKNKSSDKKNLNKNKDCDLKQRLPTNECAQAIKPMMQDLERANSSVNAPLAMDTLQKLLNNVEIITPQFVRETKIGLLIKKTRKKIGSNHSNVEKKCREVTAELKRVFAAKEKSAKLSSNKQSPKLVVEQETDVEASKIKKEKPDGPSDDINCSTNLKIVKKANFISDVNVKKEDIIEDSSTKSGDILPSDTLSSKFVLKEEELVPTIEGNTIKKDRTAIVQPVKIELAETPKPEKSRPSNRGFSLRGMFEKPKKAAISKEITDISVNLSPTKNRIPSWLTDSAQSLTFPEESCERNLGLEVLLEAVSVPSGEGLINKSSVARAIEAAIYKWSNSLSWNQRGTNYSRSSIKAYWEKIDDVVAALSGTEKGGSIVQRISDGDFSTPEDLIKLPRKTFFLSFLEKPIFL